MQIDALALRLRPRTGMEASDLGVRLCQAAARDVAACSLVTAVPVILLSLASFEIAAWLPVIVVWWMKPWLDRSILFVLSRAAFGQRTALADLWRARRHVWWGQLLLTLTLRRLSPWRSFTQPVYQLEGLGFLAIRARVVQIRRRTTGAALLVAHAFSVAETACALSLISLVFWLAPRGMIDLGSLLAGELNRLLAWTVPIAYACAVVFVEPFFVAAGFAMYLNRRAELEAWDIEQEFKRAFGG